MATPIFIVLLISISVNSVTGVDISVFPTSLNEGATLTITCRQQALPPGTTLFSLALQMARDAQEYVPVLIYDLNLNDPAGDPYLPTWGDNLGDIQQRANFTSTFAPDKTSGSFEFRIYMVKCSDAASFRCRRTASGSEGTVNSNAQNVTIHGVTQSLQITGAEDCNTFTDPYCARCQNFDDPFGVQPKYAEMGQPLLLTCAGQLATPTSQNKAIWYKQNLSDREKVILSVNTTELEYDPPSPNACSVRGSSTLTYYPQPSDRELRITCEITGGMSVDAVSEAQICVEGLIYDATTVRPVTGVDISVFPTTLNEGATLTITCREQALSQGSRLFGLTLQMARDAQGYVSVLTYDINVNDPNGDPYLPTWGSNLGDLQQRANFTSTFASDKTSGSFEFRIYSVKCNDAASFRCRRTASGREGTVHSNAQNITIHGVTQSLQITGAEDCNTFTDPDCARCQNFDDLYGVQPKYARMGQPLLLTCAGHLATPTSQNKAVWYKQNILMREKVLLTVNTTELVYDPPSPNACSVYGRSTLTYYPQPSDRELRIWCEITSGISVDTVSVETQICVEGLIWVTTTVSPASTHAPFYRTPAIVQNITRTSAILLIDLRDPPTQSTSTGYRISCEESRDKKLVYNTEIEKKDPAWGNGTARFFLIGLTAGSMYSCQASSQTPLGPGWMERFSFNTSFPEMGSSAQTAFPWQRTVGLSGAGLLAFWSVLVLQTVAD